MPRVWWSRNGSNTCDFCGATSTPQDRADGVSVHKSDCAGLRMVNQLGRAHHLLYTVRELDAIDIEVAAMHAADFALLRELILAIGAGRTAFGDDPV